MHAVTDQERAVAVEIGALVGVAALAWELDARRGLGGGVPSGSWTAHGVAMRERRMEAMRR